MLRGASHFVCLTPWVRDSYVNEYGIAPERIDVLPVGADLALWQPLAKCDAEQEVGPLRILFVGYEFQRKGGETLLRAFRALPPGTAELHMVTRPPAPEGEGIFLHTRLQPNSPELIRLYQTADVLALPTEADTFGIVAVEASAAGIPAIVSDIGGVASIVEEGVTGFVIRPGDAEALSARSPHVGGRSGVVPAHGDGGAAPGRRAFRHAQDRGSHGRHHPGGRGRGSEEAPQRGVAQLAQLQQGGPVDATIAPEVDQLAPELRLEVAHAVFFVRLAPAAEIERAIAVAAAPFQRMPHQQIVGAIRSHTPCLRRCTSR